jgi:DNA polymerase-4
VLTGLVERVTRRMRAAGRMGRTITLRLRFADYARITRSHTLNRATDETRTVLQAARALLSATLPLIEARGASLVGVAVANLDDSRTVQLCLPFVADPAADLDAVVDAVRKRFGSRAISRGTLLGRDPGPTVPMLPD